MAKSRNRAEQQRFGDLAQHFAGQLFLSRFALSFFSWQWLPFSLLLSLSLGMALVTTLSLSLSTTIATPLSLPLSRSRSGSLSAIRYIFTKHLALMFYFLFHQFVVTSVQCCINKNQQILFIINTLYSFALYLFCCFFFLLFR